MSEQSYYVTKYALTEGIQTAVGEIRNGYLYAKIKRNSYPTQFGRRHYHATKEEARKAAAAMANRKINSLIKQLARARELLEEFRDKETP